jgi:hypothetical protein
MTKNSCSAELIVDNENGFLAEENAESFAEKICELVEKPDLIKQAGLNAGKTLYRSWEMVAEEVLEKYKKIVKDYNRKKEMYEELKRLGKEHIRKLAKEKKLQRKEKRLLKKRK